MQYCYVDYRLPSQYTISENNRLIIDWNLNQNLDVVAINIYYSIFTASTEPTTGSKMEDKDYSQSKDSLL